MNKGFTLIELLVVVLIVGILAAVALPQYTKAVEKARAAEAVSLLGDVMTGIRVARLGGVEPTSLAQLDIDLPGVSGNYAHTNNFTFAITGAGQAKAVRSGGLYELVYTVDSNGGITRTCNDANGKYCTSIANSAEWQAPGTNASIEAFTAGNAAFTPAS